MQYALDRSTILDDNSGLADCAIGDPNDFCFEVSKKSKRIGNEVDEGIDIFQSDWSHSAMDSRYWFASCHFS